MDRTNPLDHQGLEVLSPEECWRLLREAPVGRVAFLEAGQPQILPVNHGVLGHRVVIRTARGALLNQAVLNRPLAFEVDGYDEATRTGWSVVVRGLGEPLRGDADPASFGLEPWADAVARDEIVELWPEEVTGRRIVRDAG